MPRLRLRNRATVQRASPNPAGDGAGNFQDGWDDYLTASCAIEPRLSGGENQREGQMASAQAFFVSFRANTLSQAIDARDRIQEVGGPARLFNVVANLYQPGQPMVKLLCDQTPVQSAQPDGYEPGGETESPPVFAPGP